MLFSLQIFRRSHIVIFFRETGHVIDGEKARFPLGSMCWINRRRSYFIGNGSAIKVSLAILKQITFRVLLSVSLSNTELRIKYKVFWFCQETDLFYEARPSLMLNKNAFQCHGHSTRLGQTYTMPNIYQHAKIAALSGMFSE